MTDLLKSIIENEGFSHVAYPDPLSGGKPYTFGHGLTYISHEESVYCVRNRIKMIDDQLNIALSFYKNLSQSVKDVLIEMAYQMGLDGLLKFKTTLHLISKGDYSSASLSMLDSKWFKQTPKRAKKLSDKLRNSYKG